MFAIGLRCRVAGVEVQTDVHPNEGVDREQAFGSASAQSGYLLVGGGARVHWEGEGRMLTASYPLDGQTWEARSKDHERESHGT